MPTESGISYTATLTHCPNDPVIHSSWYTVRPINCPSHKYTNTISLHRHSDTRIHCHTDALLHWHTVKPTFCHSYTVAPLA